MMRRVIALMLATWPAAAAAQGTGGVAGDFDYYVLALSWSPNWCAATRAARDHPDCREGADVGWILHGLWPQFESGYPEYCYGHRRDATRAETAAAGDIMGGAGAAWYQWQKHGRCSGLTPDVYFDVARAAFDGILTPPEFDELDTPSSMPAAQVERSFLSANPELFADAVTITCRDGRLREARICLTRDELAPRRCGNDVIRDCTLAGAMVAPTP